MPVARRCVFPLAVRATRALPLPVANLADLRKGYVQGKLPHLLDDIRDLFLPRQDGIETLRNGQSPTRLPGLSGTSSAVSVAKRGTPNTLTMLLPAIGLFGSSSSTGTCLTI